MPSGVTGRRVKLLKTAAPRVSRFALLSTTPGRGGHEQQLADAQRAAATLDFFVKSYRATSLVELEQSVASMAADGTKPVPVVRACTDEPVAEIVQCGEPIP